MVGLYSPSSGVYVESATPHEVKLAESTLLRCDRGTSTESRRGQGHDYDNWTRLRPLRHRAIARTARQPKEQNPRCRRLRAAIGPSLEDRTALFAGYKKLPKVGVVTSRYAENVSACPSRALLNL